MRLLAFGKPAVVMSFGNTIRPGLIKKLKRQKKKKNRQGSRVWDCRILGDSEKKQDMQAESGLEGLDLANWNTMT